MVKSPEAVHAEEARAAPNLINLFVYGTLRMDEGAGDGSAWTMDGFDGTGYPLTRTPGAYRLDEAGLWTYGPRQVPAVGWRRDCHVIGDVFSIDMARFAQLLRYEGYPSLYNFEEVTVYRRETGRPVKAVVFMAKHPDTFGVVSPTGDWIDPGFTEEEARDFIDENGDPRAVYSPVVKTPSGPTSTTPKGDLMCRT